MLTRVYIDKDSEENDLEQVNPIEWMKLNSKSDRVKKLFESSINPTIDYSAQADFLVVNKKRLGNIPGFADQLKALESELYNAGAMFDEDGYVVLSVKKAESYIDRISNMVDVTDKLGRHFLELEF
jgi:hypothetical protein